MTEGGPWPFTGDAPDAVTVSYVFTPRIPSLRQVLIALRSEVMTLPTPTGVDPLIFRLWQLIYREYLRRRIELEPPDSGRFDLIDQGPLDLGVTRDPVLDRTNDFYWFMEEWIGLQQPDRNKLLRINPC